MICVRICGYVLNVVNFIVDANHSLVIRSVSLSTGVPGDERETDLITREWSCFGTFPTDRTLFISESGFTSRSNNNEWL